MEITINDERIEIPDNVTVDKLKEICNISSGGVAIAVNGKIVMASEYSSFTLNAGDEVIIIGVAYGG